MRIQYRLNLSAGCLALAGAVILSFIIPSQIGMETQVVYGISSRSLPYGLCILMGVCGAGLIFQSLILKKDEVREIEVRREAKAMGYMLVLLAYGYTFSCSFLISTSLLGAATLAFCKCRKVVYYMIVIAVVVALYATFTQLLHVRLP